MRTCACCGVAPVSLTGTWRLCSCLSAASPLLLAVLPSYPQFVLNTSRDVGELREMLATLYDDVFVDCVIKSPAYLPGQPFA